MKKRLRPIGYLTTISHVLRRMVIGIQPIGP